MLCVLTQQNDKQIASERAKLINQMLGMSWKSAQFFKFQFSTYIFNKTNTSFPLQSCMRLSNKFPFNRKWADTTERAIYNSIALAFQYKQNVEKLLF